MHSAPDTPSSRLGAPCRADYTRSLEYVLSAERVLERETEAARDRPVGYRIRRWKNGGESENNLIFQRKRVE